LRRDPPGLPGRRCGREYLARRFADNRFPEELAVVLHRHTDGNPLFLVNTMDDLVARAQVHEVDGVWELEGAADDIASARRGRCGRWSRTRSSG
jgi:hypothetical protein